jgi:hypothetical protein
MYNHSSQIKYQLIILAYTEYKLDLFPRMLSIK